MPRKILGSLIAVLILGCGSDAERPAVAGASNGLVKSRAVDGPAVVFLGTSLTAGLGVPEDQAFPALIQDTLDALGIDLRVINAGVSGETTAGGRRRIDWLVQQPVAVLVIELGANDALRGLEIEQMRENLQVIIDRTRASQPDAAIALVGMRAPPNLGRRYTTRFAQVFPDLAAANDVVLIPFLLDSVGGIPELNQADGIHPTAEGHRILARTVWRGLEAVLREAAGGPSN